jgi:hypothetical protein
MMAPPKPGLHQVAIDKVEVQAGGAYTPRERPTGNSQGGGIYGTEGDHRCCLMRLVEAEQLHRPLPRARCRGTCETNQRSCEHDCPGL